MQMCKKVQKYLKFCAEALNAKLPCRAQPAHQTAAAREGVKESHAPHLVPPPATGKSAQSRDDFSLIIIVSIDADEAVRTAGCDKTHRARSRFGRSSAGVHANEMRASDGCLFTPNECNASFIDCNISCERREAENERGHALPKIFSPFHF